MGSTGMIGKITVLAAGPTARFLWPTLALVGALLAGAVIIALVERWRKKPSNEGVSAADQLSHFRNLYEQGAMSKEEFEAVKVQLSGKLRDELKLKPTTAENPPAADPTQPPEPPANGAVKG